MDETKSRPSWNLGDQSLAYCELQPNGIIFTDLNFDIQFINHSALSLFDWRKHESIGQNLLTLCQSQQIPTPLPTDSAYLIQQGDLKDLPAGPYDSPTGARLELSWSIQLLKKTKTPTGFAIEIKDLGSIDNLQARLEQLEIVYNTFIEKIPIPIFWKNRQGVFIGCNQFVLNNMAGVNAPKDMIGKTDKELPWHASAEALAEIDRRVIEGGETVVAEDHGTIASGEYVHYISTKTPLKNKEGKIIGMLGIGIDIAKQKKLERELTEEKEKAEIANQAKSEFLAVMSHELRTPLNAIMGMTQLLQKQQLTSDQRESLDTIYASGHNLLGLINDILYFARLEAGKLQLDVKPFDLRKLIEQLTDQLQPQANEKNIEFIVDYDNTLPHRLVGDGRRTHQILLNLVGNAIKFTPSGHILIGIESIEENNDQIKLQITIEDTGIGIPKDKLEYIFERFAQIDTAYQRQHSGVGLGLAITKQLVDMMNGEINVNSQLGSGATFWVNLPYVLESQAVEHTIPTMAYRALKILIVDDNPVEQSNTDQVSAKDALQFIQEKAQSPYQIIAVNQSLKNADAFDLGKAIGQATEKLNTMLVLLTPARQKPNRKQLTESGYFCYLSKPIKPSFFMSYLVKNYEQWQQENNIPQQTETYPACRILVVEDNVINQKVAKMMLEEEGCTVDIAESGSKAIANFANNYDIIFMDIGLPDIDGLSATQEIRKRETGHIPIIAMTAHALPSDKEKCLEAGMDEVLTKPIMQDELRGLLLRFQPGEK